MRSRSRRLTVLSSLFFFNDTATTEIYPLSLHDALPIWVGLGHLRRGDRRLEPRAHAPLVRREVVVRQRALLADPEQHVHALGRHALNGRDAGAVEAELQDVRGLLGAGQLGVERLVAPAAEPRGPLDFDEKVRAPAPPAVH